MPKYVKEADHIKLLERVKELEKSSTKPVKLKIQSGVLMTDSENNPMKIGQGERSYFWDIEFDEPFNSVPKVHRGIIGLHANHDNYMDTKIWTELVDVTEKGFRLRAGTWDISEIKSLLIDWLAYGE